MELISPKVIFCSRSPLTFRKALDSDYRGSPLRKHILGSLADREIDVGRIVDDVDASQYILRDGDHRLGRLQEAQGQQHWKGEVLSCVIGQILTCRSDAGGSRQCALGNVLRSIYR